MHVVDSVTEPVGTRHRTSLGPRISRAWPRNWAAVYVANIPCSDEPATPAPAVHSPLHGPASAIASSE